MRHCRKSWAAPQEQCARLPEKTSPVSQPERWGHKYGIFDNKFELSQTRTFSPFHPLPPVSTNQKSSKNSLSGSPCASRIIRGARAGPAASSPQATMHFKHAHQVGGDMAAFPFRESPKPAAFRGNISRLSGAPHGGLRSGRVARLGARGAVAGRLPVDELDRPLAGHQQRGGPA